MEGYIVEEVDSSDLPETELNEFHVIQPLQLADVLREQEQAAKQQTSPQNDDFTEDEEYLIKQFMSEQGELPDLYTKLKPDEDECEENEQDIELNTSDSNYGDRPMQVSDEQSAMDTSLAMAMSTINVATTTTTSTSLNKARKLPSTSLSDDDDDDDDDDYKPSDHSDDSDEDYGKRRRVRHTERSMKRRTLLNAALQGLMGEANLSFARGQTEIAEKICLEIIRQNPLAPEPFLTLASIYETRDTEKFLNFLTIAAHLKPGDREQWVRIAEMHEAQGNLPQARIYYTKAIKNISKDYDLRLRKARLLEKMGEENSAMFTYLKMLPHVPPAEYRLSIQTAKRVARHFHSLHKHHFAMDAMDISYNTCGNKFSIEDIHVYVEIVMLNKLYEKALNILRKNTNIVIDTENDEREDFIICCLIPEDYIPELRAKTCVCLIHMRAFHLLGYLIQNIHDHIPVEQERMDLYVDVAEALMQEEKYEEVLKLLAPLVNHEQFECPAFVWLKQADCLRLLERYNEAIESFQRVVSLAPFCYEAKFTLSALLKQKGRHLEAIKALEQYGEKDGEPVHARLLYERCIMLQQVGFINEFLDVGYALLSRHSIELRNREELFTLANGGNFYNPDGLKVILQMRNLTESGLDKLAQDFNKMPTEKTDLTIAAEYELFKQLLDAAFELKRFPFIQRLCFAMSTTRRFQQYHNELERIVILACYFNDDCPIGFSYLRELISKKPECITNWNVLSLFVQKGQHLRYHRFARRLITRSLNSRKMNLFLAHYHLHCSSFKYALNIYVPLYKQYQMPIVALCIAVVFNQLSMQKKVLRKSAALAQAISFAEKYAELRAAEYGATTDEERENVVTRQEICYNIGRIYHQSGLSHLAVEYYERALRFTHPLIEEHAEQLSLKQEIAFNLHLIYRANGNLRKARQYLYEYIVV